MAQTTKKKGRPTKAELEKRRRAEEKKRLELEREQRRKARFAAGSIVLFAVGLFLLALTLITGERAWLAMHNGIFGLFGVVAYAVGPLVIYVAVLTALERRGRASQVVFAVLLLAAVCGAVLIFADIPVDGNTFWEKLRVLYTVGATKVGGGLVSALFGWSLLSWFGKTGAAVTIIILALVFLMLLTGKTVVAVALALRDAARKAKERRLERESELEPEPEHGTEVVQKPSRRALEELGIDIPLEPASKKLRKTGTVVVEKDPAKASLIDVPFDAPLPVASIAPVPGKRIDIPLDPRPAPVPHENTPEENVREYFESLDKDVHTDEALDAVIHRAASASKNPPPEEAPITVSPPEFSEYKFPPVSLLNRMGDRGASDITAELRANADKLVRTLESFGVKTRVVDISRGPTVTRYELAPNQGVKISKISGLADDIALSLATAGVRIEAPIPNKSAVGIEVPNREKSIVSLRSIIESRAFREAKDPLTVAFGKDIDGQVRIADIAKMPHMLVAGATNSGKSVCLNSIIMSVLYKSSPSEVRLILIDPKSVELIGYNGIPHLLVPVVTDPKKASGALAFAVNEMMKRYRLFAEKGVKNLDSYNRHVELQPVPSDPDAEPEQKLPRILIIIDELSDLMMAAPNEVEDAICRLAQLARAAGIHLIVATQRPSVDVVTGLIKANIPSRVAFAVSSQIDSRTILGNAGAEKLLGRGDMLFQPMDLNKPVRLQGCYVSEEETQAVIDFVKNNSNVQYSESIIAEIERNAAAAKGQSRAGESEDDYDVMLEPAIDTVVEMGSASTSMLQRKLRLGYARAARIIEQMEGMGIVGPPDGAKPRAVLITRVQWQERKQNLGG